MKKAIILSSATALLVAGGVAIAAPGGKGMMRADANNDNQVTRAELTASLEERWTKMDVNQDGQLSQSDREARRAERFSQMDSNGDGGVSQAEMEAYRATRKAERFAKADVDGNGTLSQEEMQAVRGKRGGKQARKGGKGRLGKILKRADTNGDQMISRAEFDTAALARFDKVDANKDGVITAEEQQAAREARRGNRNRKGG